MNPALRLTPDGDIVYPSQWITDPAELVAQKALIRLRTFLGEWILDRFVGVPWLAFRERKATPANLELIRATVVSEVAGIPGVTVTGSKIERTGRQVVIQISMVYASADGARIAAGAAFGFGEAAVDPMSLRLLTVGAPYAA